MKKNASIMIALLFCTTSALASPGAQTTSTDYIDKVVSHLDGLKKTKKEISSLKANVDGAQSSVNTVQRQIRSNNQDIQTAQSDQTNLPSQISKDTGRIEAKKSESNRIFERHFPGFNSADEAVRSVNRRKNRILEEKRETERRLSRRTSEIDGSINQLNRELSDIEQKLRTKESRLHSIGPDLDRTKHEYRDAKRDFSEAKRLRDDPNLPHKIKKAQEHRAHLKKTLDPNNKKCRGIKGAFRSACAKIRAAKNEIRRLQDIQSGSLVRTLRQKKLHLERKLTDLENEYDQLADDIDFLKDDKRRTANRLANLREDKRSVVRPIERELEDINDRLERLSAKAHQADMLGRLANEISSLRAKVKRNQTRLSNLPEIIGDLKELSVALNRSLSLSENTLISAQEDADKAISKLEGDKVEITTLRNEMLSELSQISSLNPAQNISPSIDTHLLESRDWDVLKTENDTYWNRPTCRAETVTAPLINDAETTASLKVVNMENPAEGYNEPLVVVTVSSETLNLADYQAGSVTASNGKSYSFDVIYSKSDESNLFLMADLKDRAALINLIIKKSRLKMTLSNAVDGASSITFSLKGSKNAVKSSRSSLKNLCGGISVSK